MRVSRFVTVLLLLPVIVAFAFGCRRREPQYAQPIGGEPVPQQQPQILAVTGASQSLSPVTQDQLDEDQAALSPDGSTLLFHTWWADPSTQQNRFAIVGTDPNTGARRSIYTSQNSSAHSPAWLPDGSSFVYVSDAVGQPSLVRALSSAPNAGVAVVLSASVAPNPMHPSVSPDGRRVAFHAEIRGSPQIGVVGVDGSGLTILGDGYNPAWSPDGSKLAFTRTVSGFDQLFLVDPNTGTGLVQLTNEASLNRAPAWSPDGAYLVFMSNRAWQSTPGGSTEGTWHLYVLKPDGTGLIKLTDGYGIASFPSWGRDGWIYFSSNANGNYDIWRLQPNLGVAQQQPQGGPPQAPTAPLQPPPAPPPPAPRK